ncbi:MAG: hypothetical protein KDD56_05885 [Bdellovibrionales bacterium]|nr:hypothetical protein [Bdellovibrionales bacterium]
MEVEYFCGNLAREIFKTDIFLSTAVSLSPVPKDLIFTSENSLNDSHQVYLRYGNEFYKPSHGFALAYEFAKNSEYVFVSPCEFSYTVLKEALSYIGKDAYLLGFIDCNPISKHFSKEVRRKLDGFPSDWCFHLAYNNGFSSAVPEAQFCHFSNLDIRHNSLAVENYINPFVNLVQEFLPEFSERNSFISIKTAIASQRANPVQGVDPAVKHNMEGLLRLATRDLQLRGVHFVQIKEGTVDMNFYDSAHNTAHNFYMAFKAQLGFTFAVEKKDFFKDRDEEVRKILLELIETDYGNCSRVGMEKQKNGDIEYINWIIDNYSLQSPAVSASDFAKLVYYSAKLFLESRASKTGKLTIPAIFILPYDQEQALAY